MIGRRQQMVSHQRIEEELGRHTRCPKNVSQGGDDEAGRDASAKDQASDSNRERLEGMSAQRLRTHSFRDEVLPAIGHGSSN